MTNLSKNNLRIKDVSIFIIMGVLAACGLIYEYLMSHYAARILGAMETTIYGMIGIMIVSMGIGALWARKIKDHFQSFVYLELTVAFLGATSTTIIALINAGVNLLPEVIGMAYGMPDDTYPQGGWIYDLKDTIEYFPFFMGGVLGVMIGMEIPLIARVREHYLLKNKEHNAGTIYGADYIGAGIGATIWIAYMVYFEPSFAAALTGTANLIAGMYFLIIYKAEIKRFNLLVFLHFLVALPIVFVYTSGATLDHRLEDILYKDNVVLSMNTKYQRLTLTKRKSIGESPASYTFYINGRTQFSSSDEEIYHSFLTTPAMLASNNPQKILIIGGGDGLAVRDVLRWNPSEVILADLDKDLTDLFKYKSEEVDNQILLELNDYSLSDPRVDIIHGDAYITVEKLIAKNAIFDAIIVDLPDPSHPNLNKMYSVEFYSKLKRILNPEGAISIQSTSPYHAKKTFLSIGKTVKESGFSSVEQFHHNVPSFGEWGWTIATKYGSPASIRIKQNDKEIMDNFLTRPMIDGSFNFSKDFYKNIDKIKVNRLNSMTAYRYHNNDWEVYGGVYQND